jgi:hypothetical protein
VLLVLPIYGKPLPASTIRAYSFVKGSCNETDHQENILARFHITVANVGCVDVHSVSGGIGHHGRVGQVDAHAGMDRQFA